MNRYIYGTNLDDLVLEVSGSGAITYCHTNNVGSVIASTNASGVTFFDLSPATTKADNVYRQRYGDGVGITEVKTSSVDMPSLNKLSPAQLNALLCVIRGVPGMPDFNNNANLDYPQYFSSFTFAGIEFEKALTTTVCILPPPSIAPNGGG